jgi:hypothetical protein
VTAKPAVDDRSLPMSVAGTWRRCPNVGFQTLAAMRRASGDANDVLRTSMLSHIALGNSRTFSGSGATAPTALISLRAATVTR